MPPPWPDDAEEATEAEVVEVVDAPTAPGGPWPSESEVEATDAPVELEVSPGGAVVPWPPVDEGTPDVAVEVLPGGTPAPWPAESEDEVTTVVAELVMGPTGPQGGTGAAGVPGGVGPAGPTGAGATGPMGVQGRPGPDGRQGPAGPQGPTGSQGAPGTAGPQGPTGMQGPAGPQGATGIQGITGPRGGLGDAGPTGPQGATGAGSDPGFPQVPSVSDFYIIFRPPLGADPEWVIPTLDMLGPAFAITSFAGGQIVELGTVVVNPAFTASYSTAPASAAITNTDLVDSPLALSSPYLTSTVVGSFTKSAPASTTFTLTAVGATTQTRTVAIAWQPRMFGGLSAGGATSSTASGNSAVLIGATGTLAQSFLASTAVGLVFGPYSPSAQKITLQLPHTSTPHTFLDGNGFGFVMGAPTRFTFTNQHGATVDTDIYESANFLSTPFSVKVAT